DRLARRDPALREDPVHLHAPVLRDREQEIEDLGGLQVLGRIQQQAVDLRASRLEVALQARTACADLVRALQSVHSLGEGTLWSRACLNLRRRRGGGHAARYYTRRAGPEGSRPTFFRNFARPLGELQVGWGYLTVLASFAGIFPWSRSSAGARLGKSPLLAQKRAELGGDATAGGGIA